MKFVDKVTLYVKAGDGGPGCVSFYRGAGVPKGGPDGGDGGGGGAVIFRADNSVSTLLDLRYARRIVAKNGQPGMGKECNGRKAEPTIVRVPVGTLIWNTDTGEQLADLSADGQEVLLAKGGMGGLGNMNFATSVRRAPTFAQPGTPGQEFNIRLELRLLADVGLVGFPNVGKSTLISRISAAKPKIADYPFTTLVPNLGVVRVDEGRSFVVADIPGLIPGASTGAGLGVQFLRHVSRVRVIVHLLAFDFAEDRDPAADYKAIRKELKAFDKTMLETKEILVLNKSELSESSRYIAKLEKLAVQQNKHFIAISAVTGQGLKELVSLISKVLADPSAADLVKKQAAAERPLSKATKAGKRAATSKKADKTRAKKTPAKKKQPKKKQGKTQRPGSRKTAVSQKTIARANNPKKKRGQAKVGLATSRKTASSATKRATKKRPPSKRSTVKAKTKRSRPNTASRQKPTAKKRK